MTMELVVTIILAFLAIMNTMGFYILRKLDSKIENICEKNDKDHSELFRARREIEKDLTEIQTLHEVKGCGVPH